MYHIYFHSLLLLFGCTIEASHFRGGTITWKPINNNITVGTLSVMITQTYSWTLSQVGCNSSMISNQSPLIDLGTKAGSGADLMCNASCSTSGGYVGHEVPITGACIDFSTALDLTVSQRSDLVNLTAGADFVVTFGAGGGWQTLALGNSAGWSLSCTIDLIARSDNGLINTPPVATCISYISIPVNVQQIIQIPVLDADNDFIRCRFANGTSECVNACPPTSLPSGTTLSSSCALTITGITVGDYYLIPIQVEDFMTNTSTIPSSSVPLQFLIYVYEAPNCTLKPLLVSNHKNGDCIGVQVGVNFTMTLTAINQCGSGQTIIDIATLSFPILIKNALVQNTTNTSLWSMTITWIPTASEVGSLVFCAVATDNASVQSDQYCLTFFVGLNSVPLCPGVTVAATTMETTMETSTVVTVVTSQQPSTDSTGGSTVMDITSSSIVQTSTILISSSLSSSTVKPKSAINWVLILGLSLLALVLALCCSLCYWYYIFFRRNRERRKKQVKEWERNFQWRQPYETSDQHLLKMQGSIPQRIMSDEMPVENRTPVLSIVHDSFASLIFPSSASTIAETKSISVIKLPRLCKSSVEPYQFASRINVKVQSAKSARNNLNSSGSTRTKQGSASHVSVSRIRRFSSVDRINCSNQSSKTVSSNNHLN